MPDSRSVHRIPNAGEVVGGKYRIIRLIAEGGMGAVLHAEHELTQKQVAIKWLRPEIAGAADAQARFLREAQASVRVRHPNIVDVYDVVHDGDAIFLVMELLEGETLTALLRRGGIPICELIDLLLPAFRAVAAAHRQGVVHRDLKPDNIFLARVPEQPRPIPKVLDFGISKVSDGSSLTLTRTGAAMGTPMYMSLEQLCGEKDIDARTDVYALGVILYEAVIGRAPFEAETFSELAIKVATVEPPAPKQIRPELPRALTDVIGAAMAKKREHRLASVDELVRRLEPFADERSFRRAMTRAGGAVPDVLGDSQAPAAALVASTQPHESASSAPSEGALRGVKSGLGRGLRPALIGATALAGMLLAALAFRTGGSGAPAALVPPKPPLAPSAPASTVVTRSVQEEPMPVPIPSARADAAVAWQPPASPPPTKIPQAAKGKKEPGRERDVDDLRPRDAQKLRRPAVKRAGEALAEDF